MSQFNHVDFLAVQILKEVKGVSTIQAKNKYLKYSDEQRALYRGMVALEFGITKSVT